MEIKAKARHIRTSPRKVRLVIDVIRGMRIKEAQLQLKFMKKAAAEPVLKLLNSAVANAQHNFQIDTKELYIKTITADEGPTLRRWTPKAFGRTTPIRKRSTHISIILDEKMLKRTATEKQTEDISKKRIQKIKKVSEPDQAK